MSSFTVWVDDSNVAGNCQSSSDFANDGQRQRGFQPGYGASAIRMNTALRQANLIAVALVNALGIPNSYNVASSLDSMTTWFQNSDIGRLSRVFDFGQPGTENKLNENIIPKFNDSVSLGAYGTAFKRIYAKTFEGDLMGTAQVARYADDDYTKGTIETRLTKLGFKEGSIDIVPDNDGTTYITGATPYEMNVYRIGKFIIGRIRLNGTIKYTPTQKKVFAFNTSIFNNMTPPTFTNIDLSSSVFRDIRNDVVVYQSSYIFNKSALSTNIQNIEFAILKDGTIHIFTTGDSYSAHDITFNFGFPLVPISKLE